MAKIYYSIDTSARDYPVSWLDEHGEKHTINLSDGKSSPADVDMEFRLQHPRAVWLKWDDFCKRLALIAHEKEKLAGWLKGQGL